MIVLTADDRLTLLQALDAAYRTVSGVACDPDTGITVRQLLSASRELLITAQEVE